MESDRPRSQNEILGAALRLVRLHRRMRPAEVAEAMGMAKRSYEHFEAGKGKINLDRIHRFAAATDSDPYAIIDCMALGSPEFAVRCADNKAMLALRVAAQEFDEAVGDAIMELDTRSIINAFTRALKDLGMQAVRRDDEAKAWLADRIGRLVTPSSEEDG
ncbi:helix-turn-helix domain-containing protein [Brevundimonas sp.]|jgi:transcriptional regulator with XRE-family HTH domain|uniref:helix-turn-helix domain-containing protein n=1 Tax=Brevundimonas sp. TaxID=1871086 RepID=UPI0037C0AC9B